jgi:hypothetical protein
MQASVRCKAEIESKCLCFHEFDEQRFERIEEGRYTITFPRLIRTKLRLKIEDNRLHLNG